MTTCDMCGNNKGPFYNAKLEGSNMKVCSGCRTYAKEAWLIKDTLPEEKQKPKFYSQRQEEKKKEERGEIIQLVVGDYGKKIKQAREKLGFKQEILAKKLAEKESLLHTWESGKRKPSIEMARKLEKFLHIKLIMEHEEKHQTRAQKQSGPLTIADLLKK